MPENKKTSIILAAAPGKPTIGQSKVGGRALLQDGVDVLLDRNGRRMRLLIQINFLDLPKSSNGELPEEGLLAVFVSEDIESRQAKDRKRFRIIWQPKVTMPLNVVQQNDDRRDAREADEQKGDEQKDDDLHTHEGSEEEHDKQAGIALVAASNLFQPYCKFLESTDPNFEEAKLICAFSENGISYSPVRAKDDCYAHLVDQADFYQPLFHLVGADNRQNLLLIHKNDFTDRRFEKAWLLRFAGNNWNN